MQVYENISTGQVRFAASVSPIVRALLQAILNGVADSRPSLNDIKKHQFFRGIDFE